MPVKVRSGPLTRHCYDQVGIVPQADDSPGQHPHMITFIAPDYLWLLLVLPLLWAVAWLVPYRTVWHLFWGSLALRTLIVVALALALSGTQVVWPADHLNVVFLLDSSDSVDLAQRARAEAYIQEALSRLPEGNQAGVVVFGERAQVERPLSDQKLFGQITTLPGGARTNIQEAVQLGLALLPAEGQRRLVLLSDGGENSGDAREAARLAAAQGTPIEVIPLSSDAMGLDAQISGIELPSSAREGQSLRLVVRVESDSQAAALPARLVVEHSASQSGLAGSTASVRQIVVNDAIELDGGEQRFEIILPPPQSFFNRYVVRLALENDARPENNAAEAYTFVSGEPRVLLIEGFPAAARNLEAALASAQLDVTRVAVDDAPTSLGVLSAYEAVVLVNVARRELPQRTADLLPVYVRDLGRGLAMVGGDQSFGAGGWRDTAIEEALPVDMDLRTDQVQLPVSVVVVIDVSGSMGASDGEFTKVELASEGAARIATQLRDFDEITVIPFDDQTRGMVGPLSGAERDQAIERIGGISAGGSGINIFDALQAAAQVIRASEKPVRHIFTITDGSDTVQQEGARELVEQLRRESITVSSIAVGNGPDVPFLEDIVRLGNGRLFLTESAAEIPEILTGEAQVLLQPFIIEGEFVPTRGAPHPLLRDIGATPPLYGYVASNPKSSAQVLLSSDRGDPVLAVWQYGLGRSLAWTPDMEGKWAKDWLTWTEYQRFATQMVAWLLPATDTERLTLETRTIGDQLVLAAQVRQLDGTPATGMRVSGQMIASDGSSTAIALNEIAPGSYWLALQDMTPGAYLVQLIAADQQGQPQSAITAGTVVPLSREYHSQNDNPALLEMLAQTTGGRIDPPSAAVHAAAGNSTGVVNEVSLPLLWLALVFLPLDVALRRLGVGNWRKLAVTKRLVQAKQEPAPDRLAPAAVRRQAQTPPEPPPPADDLLERLRAAQERARRRARGEE